MRSFLWAGAGLLISMSLTAYFVGQDMRSKRAATQDPGAALVQPATGVDPTTGQPVDPAAAVPASPDTPGAMPVDPATAAPPATTDPGMGAVPADPSMSPGGAPAQDPYATGPGTAMPDPSTTAPAAGEPVGGVAS